MSIKKGEAYTRGWVVTALPVEGGAPEKISRLYHSLETANEYAELAKKSGREGVEVQTIEGHDNARQIRLPS